MSLLLVLATHSQRGMSLEPGYPELAGYRFFESDYYLAKIWISREPMPRVVEAEYIPAGSELAGLLRSGEFDRPEILRNSRYADQVLYLSELPAKGWNHGSEVDELLARVSSKRPDNIRQQLLQWVLQRLDREDFNLPRRNDYFNDTLWYSFPIDDKSKFNALILDVEWRQYDTLRSIKHQHYLIDIGL